MPKFFKKNALRQKGCKLGDFTVLCPGYYMLYVQTRNICTGTVEPVLEATPSATKVLGRDRRMVSMSDNHKIVGLSPVGASWLIKNHPAWATGDNNGALVHSAVNEYLAIDRDGNCT